VIDRSSHKVANGVRNSSTTEMHGMDAGFSAIES